MPLDVVEKFVRDVYIGLCSTEFVLNMSFDLAKSFGMLSEVNELDDKSGIIHLRNTSQLDDSDGNDGHDGMDMNDDDDNDNDNDNDLDDDYDPKHDLEESMEILGESTVPVIEYDKGKLKNLLGKGGRIIKQERNLLKESRKAAAASYRSPPKKAMKRPAETHYIKDEDMPLKMRKDLPQRIVQGPMRYSPKLSMMKPAFKKVETAKNCFYKNNGMFRATTDSFFANANVVSDRDNLILIGGTPRQFRMKLPDTKLIALVAVGVRNGDNIVTTVACNSKYWLRETTFINVIEMTKNICGTSFGAILRHPRCAEVNKDKISREAVERFKEEFRRLTENERSIIAAEHQKYLKDFDAEALKMEFHHLPQKPTKMEFTIVPDILREEIMDYAIVSGDNPNDLKMQTFINFNYTKFNTMRLITIMCDTLSCFLGLGNQTPLTDSQIFKDSFENYAKRTCQVLAVRELGISVDRFIDPANPTEVITPKRIVREASKTVMKRNIIDERRKFPCTFDGCNMAFIKEASRNAHYARIHAAVDQSASKGCSLCGKVLRGASELKVHIYYHHSQKECKKCNLTFPGAYTLYYHNARFHSEPQTCDICGQSCKNREKLKKHKINKHMEDHQKPYVCSFCGKGYAEKTKLESHQMNVHIRIRPFKCRLEGCEADFNEMANRNAHEKNVHKYDYKKTMQDLSLKQSHGAGTPLPSVILSNMPQMQQLPVPASTPQA